MMTRCLRLGIQAMICFLIVIYASAFCYSQDDRPKFVFFGGTGLANHTGAASSSVHFGLDYEQLGLMKSGHFMQGWLLEGGYIFPSKSFEDGFAVFSINPAVNYVLNKSYRAFFPLTCGYSRLFGVGNAVNFGTGYEHRLGENRSMRFEVRDYYAFTGQRGHNLALRIAIMFHIED